MSSQKNGTLRFLQQPHPCQMLVHAQPQKGANGFSACSTDVLNELPPFLRHPKHYRLAVILVFSTHTSKSSKPGTGFMPHRQILHFSYAIQMDSPDFWRIVRALRHCQREETDFLPSFECTHVPDEDISSSDRCCTFRYIPDGDTKVALQPTSVDVYVSFRSEPDDKSKLLANMVVKHFLSELSEKLYGPISYLFKGSSASLAVSNTITTPSALNQYELLRASLRGETINAEWCLPSETYKVNVSGRVVITAYAGYNSENSSGDLRMHWFICNNPTGTDVVIATICAITINPGERVFHEFQSPIATVSTGQFMLGSVEGKIHSGSLQAGIVYEPAENREI